MSITGQISLARPGENVRIFQDKSDINDIFNENVSPSLKDNDHITLYPGDFTEAIGEISIPENVYLTILPGAKVEYKFSINELEKANRLEERYENISGQVENIADLHIASQYETEVEKQYGRIRVYVDETDFDTVNPYIEFYNLDETAEFLEQQPEDSKDTVIVFPGRYEPSNNLLVNRTTWHFLPGSKVFYNPDFGEVYPYGLFDDSRETNGSGLSDNSVNAKILGRGTFVIGTSLGKLDLLRRDDQNNCFFTKNYSKGLHEDTIWKNWHKYSILSVSNPNSNIVFEAEKVKMKDEIDAAVKYAASTVNIDVNKFEVTKTQNAPQNVKNVVVQTSPEKNPQVSSFLMINGSKKAGGDKKITLDISSISIEEEWDLNQDKDLYIVSALNHDPDKTLPPECPDSKSPDSRIQFNGNLNVRVGDSDSKVTQTVNFYQETAPSSITVRDSNTTSSIKVSSNAKSTDLIVKDTEINCETSPIVLAEDPRDIVLSLSEVWFMNNTGDFVIEDKSGNYEYEVKVYKQSFANKPIKNYEEVLHDQLNNIIWTEDVTSIR